MAYRVEISTTGRAGCNGTGCKKENTKILKGELRQGTQVTIKEHTSMRWRHWGCVTPTVLHNWKESSGMDMDLVDGYDELPPEAQIKVRRALEQGHVDDEDWNGDAEMNRYNPLKPMQGMFVKVPAKKKKTEADSDDDVEADVASPKEPAKKKRSRANVEDDEDEDGRAKPAPKKSKGRKAAKLDEEAPDEVLSAPAKAKKGKASKAHPEDGPSKALTDSVGNKSKRKKAQPTQNLDSGIPDASMEAAPAPAKKGRAKKKAAGAAPSDEHMEATSTPPKPQKRQRRGKEATAAGSDDEET